MEKRSIIFHGKRVDNGEWVEGDLIQLDSRIMIADRGMTAYDKGNAHEEISLECVEVAPETVGQFTGLTDKNGKRIFEGDILGGCNGSINGHEWKQEPITITFEYGRFNVPLWAAKGEWDSTHYLIVIGNIHDSPELL